MKLFFWIKSNLFNTPVNSVISLLLLLLLYQVSMPLLNWLIFDSTLSGSAATCRENGGACWAFIQQKWSFIIFGRYPDAERWRPMAAIIGFVMLIMFSKNRHRWGKPLLATWSVYLVSAGILIAGGTLGLPPIETDLWGGFPLTLMLSTFGIVIAYPLGILLAIGRRSKMPIIRSLSIVYIELIRGVPLITILFMASIMLPLFLPDGMTINNVLRAQLAIIFFAAAYFAEVVRGGLQAIAKGQYEAADALGFTTLQSLRLVILPQALRIVIPATVGTIIEIFKDTSLVLIVGLMDLMLSSKTSTIDADWHGFSAEAYVFTAAIYFVCCYAMSRYSQTLEKEFNQA